MVVKELQKFRVRRKLCLSTWFKKLWEKELFTVTTSCYFGGESCVLQSFLMGNSTGEMARKLCLTKNNSASSREVEGKEKSNSAKKPLERYFCFFFEEISQYWRREAYFKGRKKFSKFLIKNQKRSHCEFRRFTGKWVFTFLGLFHCW